MSEAIFRIGTSGWNYKHWIGSLYPAGLPQHEWLEFYAQHFDTVEINNTFYRLPEESTFDAWRKRAPEGFVFAVKASRFLTHNKKLHEVEEPLKKFLGRARRLKDRLGPILYQLPPKFAKNVQRLREFCRLLPRNLVHVMEFRNPEWLADDVFSVLEKHKVCLCIHDLIPNHPRRVTGPIVYVRYHGHGERYSGGYPHEDLVAWSGWLKKASAEGRAVYAYFNNDFKGYAVQNAMTLRELVEGAVRAKAAA